MSKRGLPTSVQMRHDSHYVEELSTATRSIGKTIPIYLIEPNPEQPRREIGDLTELSASIKEKGVLEPLLVVPSAIHGGYMIIAGERRWRASKLAGLTEVPCIEMNLDEQGVAEIALIENLQRKDLTLWEEADGLKALADKFGYKQDEIAKKISKSRTTVTELMTVAGLPASIRERCMAAKVNSKTTLLEIARQFDEAAMFDYIERITNGKSKNVPAYKSSAAKAKSAASPVSDNSPKGKFSYISPDDLFRVEITFANHEAYDKRSILKALKQAFEDVKNDTHP
ncbi:MAG: ParB/RepB/Spo0J family partition protein [Saprospiraceae bacterium]|nr:ParB/RepB/Spo0J family partition protein [Pyrinomonadaceae bacterium]